MTSDGRAVANFVLDYCLSKERPITNLSLQKIVYFCHVRSLVHLNRPLIKQSFEAWRFGPVLEYLYREFKGFEDNPITGRATRIDPNTGSKQVVEYHFDKETESLLAETVDFYSRISAGDLVRLSHAPGGPWERAWNYAGSVNPGMKIDNAAIKKYYSSAPPSFVKQ